MFIFRSFIWFAVLVVIVVLLGLLIGAFVFFLVSIGSYDQKWVSM